MSMLEIKDLNCFYGNVQVLWDVNLHIEEGELVALLGARVFLNLDVVWLAWPISFVAGTIFPFLVYRRMFRAVPDDEADQNAGEEALL